MPNEFIVKNGLISQGNVTVSGSISTTSPINLTGFATGSVLFTSGSAGVITGSSNLSWDAPNEIFNVVGRINAKSTTAQPSSLIVEGTTGVNSGNAGFVVRTGTGYQATFFAADNLSGQGIAGLGIFTGGTTPFGLQTGAPNGAFFIHNNGNVGIGTNYTNAGHKLDVNGNARINGNLRVNNILGDAGNLVIESANSQTYVQIKPKVGNTDGVRIETDQTDTGTSGEFSSFRVIGPIFSPTTGSRTRNFISVTPVITQTGGANGITRGLHISASIISASDWRAIETTTGSVIFNGGNVAIGTPTPSASLHISGASSATLLEIDSPALNNILFVSGSGRVNINTTASRFDLTLKNEGKIGSDFISDSFISLGNAIGLQANYNVYTLKNLAVGVGDVAARLGVRGSGATSSTTALLVQNANASSSLSVLDNGNVGIGTGTPTSTLDVNGSVKVTGNIVIPTQIGYGIYSNFFDANSPAFQYGSSAVYSAASTTNILNTTSGVKRIYNDETVFKASTGSASFASFYAAPTISQSSAATGITRGLYINPTISASADFRAIETTTGSVIFNGGNVGIGTSTPSARLTISGSTAVGIGIALEDSGSNKGSFSAGNGGTYVQGFNNGLFLGTIAAPDTMKLVWNGNVLVGTTTDAGYKLDVNGTSRFVSSFRCEGQATFISSIIATAQVRIGTNPVAASAVLDVQSTTQGFLPPRMTQAQRLAISTPAVGLIVYETGSAASEGIWINETPGWQQLLTNTGSQSITGSLTVVGSSNLGGATFSNGGATFFNNVNLGALNEGSGNSWVNLNTSRVHLGQNGSTGGLNVNASNQFVGVGKVATAQLDILGNAFLTGSLTVTGSAGTGSAIYAYKSGSTVLDIQGSQGQLFSVTDALSGSLMSVNDVSGLPIIEVFSDDRIVMGTYGAPALIVNGSNTIISGSLRGRVATLSTASATASMDCALSNFFDLTLSGSMYLNVSNIQPGETINLRVTQPAVSGSLNYTSSIKFPNGLPYSVSATGSVTDIISFISFDSSTLYATSLKNLV